MSTATSGVHTVDPKSRLPYLRDMWDRREFVVFLALSDLKARYASTGLGLLWWVLNPLLLTAVYFVVFGIIFKAGQRGEADYLAYLMSGMFAFFYTRSSMTGGASSILGNKKLLVNTNFPRLLLPLSSIIESALGLFVSIGVLYAVIVPLAGIRPSWLIVWLPVAFFLQTVFNIGLAALMARAAIPFRDVTSAVPYLARIWLYLSPILWTPDFAEDLPRAAQALIKVNPMYSALSLYRTALLGTEMDYVALGAFTAWAVVIFAIGVRLFRRFEPKLAHHV